MRRGGRCSSCAMLTASHRDRARPVRSSRRRIGYTVPLKRSSWAAPVPVGRQNSIARPVDSVHIVHNHRVVSTAYVSGRVPSRYERLVARQARAARTSKSNLVARYVIEKSLETEFPGISFRDSLGGREAYVTGHRVAVWEVLAVQQETRSVAKTADHFHWPRALVMRALAYAKAFPDDVDASREGETDQPLAR